MLGPKGKIQKKKSSKNNKSALIEKPGGGRDIQREALEKICNDESKRELQGRAARYIMYEQLKAFDQFIPTPEFLWLISAGIKSGKTQMIIPVIEKLHKLYYRVYYVSPQEEHEPKVRTHLIPLIYNKDYTKYTPANLEAILNEIDETLKMAKETKCGAKQTLKEQAAQGDDRAYRALLVRELFGGHGSGVDTHIKMTRQERYERDRLLATGGRILLFLDDATMMQELSKRIGDAHHSLVGRLIRMRHKGLDMIGIVHNRGNVSTVIKGSATVDTLFDPRSPADKKAVVENTSGLSMRGLEALVELAQSTSQHATITMYKGAPMDRRYAINLNTWIDLPWNSDDPEPLPHPGPPKPAWAPSKVLQALPAGRKLLARIAKFEAGGDPDQEEGKDFGLADNSNPQDARQSARDKRNARRRHRRAVNRFAHLHGSMV